MSSGFSFRREHCVCAILRIELNINFWLILASDIDDELMNGCAGTLWQITHVDRRGLISSLLSDSENIFFALIMRYCPIIA